MRYLSCVLVDKLAVGLPRDGYAWHQRLWEAFPRPAGQARDFLFRVDERPRDVRLYVLSGTVPQTPGWGMWRTREVSDRFLMGDRYRFQIRANPTMRRAGDGRRLGLFREELLRPWMARKAESAGFDILDGTLEVGAPVERRFFRGGRMGKHIAVDFRGILHVRDHDRFRQAFEEGIGSGKAFGYGLLVLDPLMAAAVTEEG